MRLVLHIGSTKTGSSALQATLNTRREALLQEAGALYPAGGVVAGAHHLLAAAVHPGAWRMHPNAIGEDRAAFFDETAAAIRDEVEATGAQTLIISSEYFWSSLPPVTYRTFGAAFAGWPVEIVCFLRRQDEWATSSYLQAVKSGEKRSFEDWAALVLKPPASGLHYFRVINRWAYYLDATKVHVIRYADARANVLSSFCDTLGLPLDTEAAPPRVNPSPSSEGLRLLLEVNRSEVDEAEKAERRTRIMREHRADRPSTAFLLSAAERRALIAEEQASDRLIEKHFLCDGQPLFPPPEEDAEPETEALRSAS
jgi:capsular polysaccharide export protein